MVNYLARYAHGTVVAQEINSGIWEASLLLALAALIRLVGHRVREKANPGTSSSAEASTGASNTA